MAPTQIQESYRAQYGAKAIAIPSDQGLDRALWAVPIAAMALAVGMIVMIGRRWQQRGARTGTVVAAGASDELEYDSRLDEELERLEKS
jgi:cytochrome c-type biogenesis protein CcmH/NrfF